MPGGTNSIQRWRQKNPAAWEARFTVECRTCGAAIDQRCTSLDGSGRVIGTVHIARLEDVTKLMGEGSR